MNIICSYCFQGTLQGICIISIAISAWTCLTLKNVERMVELDTVIENDICRSPMDIECSLSSRTN